MVTLVPEGKINFIFDKIVVDQVWPFELIKRPSLDLNKITLIHKIRELEREVIDGGIVQIRKSMMSENVICCCFMI